MSEEESEVQFEDAESPVTYEEGLSFKELVMKHLQKISIISSKEMCAGFWQKKPISMSGGVYFSEVYVEDGRLAYSNAIDYLHDLLLPHFTPDVNTKADKINNDLNPIKKKYLDKPSLNKDDWIDEKLENKRTLFQLLSKFLRSKGYFGTGSLSDR